jgi:hypothetical protein
MNIECTYQTPRRLCDVVSPFAEKKLGKLTKRPWNRFNPDLTSWWLVPDSKIPHFKHGKIFFNWGDKKHTTLLTGLYVEKGLDEKVSSVYSSRKAKNFIMLSDWNWFSFIEDLSNKQLFEVLKNACPSHTPIEFIIDAGYVTEPTSFDPYQEKTLGWDQYIFTWHPDSNVFSMSSSNRKSFILKLHHVKTIDDFVDSMMKYTDDEWLWMNIHIAIRLHINPSAKNSQAIWNDKKIWDGFLSPLSKWIN